VSRKLFRAGLASAALLAFAGCSPGANDGGNVSLTVWSWRTEDAAAYKKIFSAYTASHKGVTVTFKPYKNTEYDTILSTGLTGSQGPDIAQIRSYGQVQPLIDAGRLVPVDKTTVPGLSNFTDDALKGARGTKDGNIYGVPFALQTMQIFYNKKIFADNGLTPPNTWDDMVNSARLLKSKGIVPFSTTAKDSWMLPIDAAIFGSARFGGPAFGQALLKGTKKFTDPDYVGSLDLMNQLKPYLPNDVSAVSYTDSQTLFVTGKAAMFPGGSWELGFFQQQAPGLDIGVFSAPPATGSPSADWQVPGFIDGSFGVNAKSEHRQQALELLAWMATPDFGQRYSDELKQISPMSSVKPADPTLNKIVAAYHAHPIQYFMTTDFANGTPPSDKTFTDLLQQMMLGKIDARTTAERLQRSVDQWFKPTP
jgi:raffinose/stachyose/melibiose transport system substrate-binding protein